MLISGITHNLNTPFGLLKGRDCIYVDKVIQNAENDLIFQGELNGELLNNCNKKWVTYQLTFKSIQGYFCLELDSYCQHNSIADSDSCFDELLASKWLESLNLNNHHKHYRLLTYDFVYHIIGGQYELSLF